MITGEESDIYKGGRITHISAVGSDYAKKLMMREGKR
jgi:hypothetical protein